MATLTPEKIKDVDVDVATVNKTYPNYNVIMLNDDGINGMDVVNALCKVLPGMTFDTAMNLTMMIHQQQSGIVWTGPQEVAELYHEQLQSLGMVMAPLEKCGS